MPNNNLATLRKKHGHSQSKLAELVGVSTLTVCRWEGGKMSPRDYSLQLLCEVLECTEEELGFSPETSTATSSADMVPLYDASIPVTPIDKLVGRETDLARIKTQLLGHTNGSMVSSALNGIPGVGKTSLAIATAHDEEIRAAFPGGILWAALGPTPNIPGLLNRWAELLGVPEDVFSKLDEERKCHKLQGALEKRSMLLVLDDVWNMSEAQALRIIGGSSCASLVTTRFPVIASEMAVEALHIEELNIEHSFDLLHALAPEVVEHEPEKTRTLVQAVGGLPLALTLLGGYLRKNSYNVPLRRAVRALEHLNDAQIRLQIKELHVQAEAHPSIASSVPISLQSIIEVSDRFLTPLAHKTLYALSIFPPKPSSFSEETALTIAACTIHELDELIDAGLLESNGSRYRLHRTIVDYARLQIDEQTEEEVIRRLIAYMQQYVESHAREYELLEQEMTLLLYALDKAMTGKAFQSQVVPLACASAPFLLMRGYYREIERFLERAYEVTLASQDATDIAGVLLYLAELDDKRGDVLRAKERYSLARQKLAPHAPLQGTLLYHVGRLAWKLGDYQEAEALLQESLMFARRNEQLALVCSIYKILAAICSYRADWKKGETYARTGLVIARVLQDRQEIIGLLINLACCLQTAERLLVCQEGLVIAREIKSHELCCLLLTNIGDWYMDTDELLQAEAYLREALLIAQQIGHKQWTCAALSSLTILLTKKEQYEEAKARLQEALTLAKTLEIPRSMCLALDAKGNLALTQRQTEDALHAFQEMRRLAPQEDFEVEALSFYGMARSYEQMGEDEQARTFGKRALVLVQQKMMIGHEQRILTWYTSSLQPLLPTSIPTESGSAICICGNTFERQSGPGRTRQYCSDRCANRERKRKQRREQQANAADNG